MFQALVDEAAAIDCLRNGLLLVKRSFVSSEGGAELPHTTALGSPQHRAVAYP